MLRFVFSQVRRFSVSASKQSTIFAVSSGQGKCGVAVVRVSGHDAGFVLQKMTSLQNLPKPRHALLRSLKDPTSGETLDKGLVLWFPGPHSFTGEDSCEFQVHGGVAVVSSILKALSSLPNLRLAAPGEFTRRAFYNGKLDLTEAEGLSDLLSAETELQRKQAFLQTEGYLSKVYKEWKKTLLRALANLEAFIDFDESEDLDQDVIDRTLAAIVHLEEDIRRHVNDGNRGERLRNGVKAVIIGETNVGKSSLINILSKRPVAIVTPIHGTTRDVLEVTLDIGGYPLVLLDTAGIRSYTTDAIESEGIERAFKACEDADLILLVIDAEKFLAWRKTTENGNSTDFLSSHLQQLNVADFLCTKNSQLEFKKQCIVVANKIDLIDKSDHSLLDPFQTVSCKSLRGMDDLVDGITKKLKILCSEPSKDHPSMNQMRHREHLGNCLKYLQSFLREQEGIGDNADLMAEKLRRALHQLDKLTGASTTEQLLDIIFKEFCIGK